MPRLKTTNGRFCLTPDGRMKTCECEEPKAECCDGSQRCRVPLSGVTLTGFVSLASFLAFWGGPHGGNPALADFLFQFDISRSFEVRGVVASGGAGCIGPYNFEGEELIALVPNIGRGAPEDLPTLVIVPPGRRPGERPEGIPGPADLPSETEHFRELIMRVSGVYEAARGSFSATIEVSLGGDGVAEANRIVWRLVLYSVLGEVGNVTDFAGHALSEGSDIDFLDTGSNPCAAGRRVQALENISRSFNGGEARLGVTSAITGTIGGPSECPELDPPLPGSCCGSPSMMLVAFFTERHTRDCTLGGRTDIVFSQALIGVSPTECSFDRSMFFDGGPRIHRGTVCGVPTSGEEFLGRVVRYAGTVGGNPTFTLFSLPSCGFNTTLRCDGTPVTWSRTCPEGGAFAHRETTQTAMLIAIGGSSSRASAASVAAPVSRSFGTGRCPGCHRTHEQIGAEL